MSKYVKIRVFALVLAAAYALTADAACDVTQCKGPLKYYNELSCKPIYENEGDCCAVAYNCDHLTTRSHDKCYYKKREYNVGETLKAELPNPCVVNCVCTKTRSGTRFLCDVRLCEPPAPTSENLTCYKPRNAITCCPDTSICVNPKDVPTCNVGGRIYQAGEFFIPPGHPNKRCYCNEGYKGENVAPFCRTESGNCNLEIGFPREIINNNPPIYLAHQSRLKSCSMLFRYPKENDEVIEVDGTSVVASEYKSGSENMQCRFGNITLNVGAKLSPIIFSTINVIECRCEVPPALTCEGSRLIRKSMQKVRLLI